jgi:hypothetical protein
MKEIISDRTINFEKFMNRINGYLFSFMETGITGKLVALENGFLTVETRVGNLICAHMSTVMSIWHVHQKQEAI